MKVYKTRIVWDDDDPDSVKVIPVEEVNDWRGRIELYTNRHHARQAIRNHPELRELYTPDSGVNSDVPVWTRRDGKRVSFPDIGEKLFISYTGGSGLYQGIVEEIINIED